MLDEIMKNSLFVNKIHVAAFQSKLIKVRMIYKYLVRGKQSSFIHQYSFQSVISI